MAAPGMIQNLTDVVPLRDVAIEHATNEIDAIVAQNERDAQVAIHDFINAVERVLLVDYGVQEDTQSPHVLLSATVRLPSQNLGRGVVFGRLLAKDQHRSTYLPMVPTKTSNGPFFRYAALPKSMILIMPSPSNMTFSSLMSR